jgi:membrane protein YqaA with SNARE-associated domain
MSSSSAAAIPWYRKPTAWIRQLYDWTLSWANTPYGGPALFVLAFIEASFFPIPADVLLIALAMSQRERAFRYAALCTAGSVCGAVLGWYIGFGLWRTMGIAAACPEFQGGGLLFEMVPGFSCAKFETVRGLYAQNAWLYLLVSAFTPIPYKLFTVASGVFSIGLPVLIAASIVGRGARFFLVAGLIHRFGPPIREFIERRFELMTLLFTVLLVGGFAIIKVLM